jgi:hypothetical protein
MLSPLLLVKNFPFFNSEDAKNRSPLYAFFAFSCLTVKNQ